MDYSTWNPAFARMHRGQAQHIAQEEIRFAQQIRAQDPSLSRDQALRKAAAILARKERYPSGAEV